MDLVFLVFLGLFCPVSARKGSFKVSQLYKIRLNTSRDCPWFVRSPWLCCLWSDLVFSVWSAAPVYLLFSGAVVCLHGPKCAGVSFWVHCFALNSEFYIWNAFLGLFYLSGGSACAVAMERPFCFFIHWMNFCGVLMNFVVFWADLLICWVINCLVGFCCLIF